MSIEIMYVDQLIFFTDICANDSCMMLFMADEPRQANLCLRALRYDKF